MSNLILKEYYQFFKRAFVIIYIFLSNMDFIKKNKILILMAVIAILSFVLEKAGVIQP